MKRIMFSLATLFFITVSPLSSYGAEMQQPTTSTTSPHKEQYEKTMEERLRELGKQLDELKVKVAEITEQTRKDVNHQLTEADKKEKAASHELEELQKKSEKEWKKFTTEMNKAADDLEKAFEHAKSRLKE